MLFSTQLAISNWSTTFAKDPEEKSSSDYFGGFKISLTVRLFQQVALLLSSVLFFLFEYYGVKYPFCRRIKTWFSWDNLLGPSRGSSGSLQFYTNPHSVEVVCVQFVSAIFAHVVSVICLSLGSDSFSHKPLAMFGFAMTGVLSAAFYAGREFHRSFVRIRRQMSLGLEEGLAKRLEFFDRLDASSWFTMVSSFGQIIPILYAMFIDEGMTYFGLLQMIGACFGIGLIPLIGMPGLACCIVHDKSMSHKPTTDSGGMFNAGARMIQFRIRAKPPKPSLKKLI
jgi:hypothetical protein